MPWACRFRLFRFTPDQFENQERSLVLFVCSGFGEKSLGEIVGSLSSLGRCLNFVKIESCILLCYVVPQSWLVNKSNASWDRKCILEFDSLQVLKN